MPRQTDNTVTLRFYWDSAAKRWSVVGRIERQGQRPIVMVRCTNVQVGIEGPELVRIMRAMVTVLEDLQPQLFVSVDESGGWE
jgi:hypothetical protein